uniref:ANK_REP_REGION domain-containing protein n=1 Tax=Globodera pallida TaxID=36090 RepID=A0A183BN05_GLOPA
MASDFNQVSESLETQFEIQGSEREFSGEEDASLPEMREICSRANLQMMAQDELMSGEPQRNEKRLTNESVPNSNCQIRVEESKKVLKSSENLQLRTIASECLGRDESVKERKGKTKPSKKPPDKLSKKVQFPKSPIRSEFPLGKENGKVWGHEEGMSENESIEFVGLKRENSRSFSWMKRRAKPDSLENESASEHGKLPHNSASDRGFIVHVDGRAKFYGHHLCGRSALFYAADEGHLQVCNVLIFNGAYRNQAAVDGATPWLIAFQNGLLPPKPELNYLELKGVRFRNTELQVCAVLISNGAYRNQAAVDGATPWLIAF